MLARAKTVRFSWDKFIESRANTLEEGLCYRPQDTFALKYTNTSIPLCLRLKRVAIMKLHEMRPEET